MGNLVSAYIYPHPPIIIPEIGKGEETPAINTINGCIEASEDLKAKKPDTVLVITPHGPAFRDAVAISVEKTLSGNFARFGRTDVRFEFQNDTDLAGSIIENANQRGILIVPLSPQTASRYGIDTMLDHGTLVPLYYVSKSLTNIKIVHVCMGFLSYKELFEFGKCIKNATEKTNGSVAIIASGDLSHRLTPDAPCGYDKHGKEFDQLLVKLLAEARFNEIMEMDAQLIETAGECGMRPFTIMFGCMDGYNVMPKVLSYEGPFGVGYCVAEFDIV